MVDPLSKFAIRLTDMAAGATVSFMLRHRPHSQMQSGDDYLERAYDLFDKNGKFLMQKDKIEIKKKITAADKIKYKRNPPDSFYYRVRASHAYNKQAKEAYNLTRELSNLRRGQDAFAIDVADAITAIAERERISSALDESADLDELRLEIVNSIESTLDDDILANYNASYTSVVNISQMAENVWATPELAELRSDLSSE
ncbi:hypothetical protein DENSPDRAFT_872764 [Dentipellis sp. KUC8613]|nr:hypothetical protein DENSPDRAFT_872764 [Dentipellis sp. KUC8613]